MTIRKRIAVIYLISVLVPLILFGTSVYVMTNVFRIHINQQVENVRERLTDDPVRRMVESIEREVKKDPNVFENEAYEAFMSSAIQMTPFEMTLYKEDQLVFNLVQDKFNENDSIHIIRKGQFENSEGAVYSYQVTARERPPKTESVKMFNQMALQYGIPFFMFYLIIHLVFFRYAIKTVFSPLGKMRNAALRIRDEKYDEEITYTGDDEVGAVFNAFEEMRLRIKSTDEVRRQYEENRKELIANISHDLKTPITAINGYVQGILDGVANTEDKMKRYIETIAVYGRDMDTLIDDLSLLSKLDLDGVQFNFQQIELAGYLTDCLEELSFDLEEKNVDQSFEICLEGEALVAMDPGQIRRVLSNIIYNAVKHFDKASSVLKVMLTETIEDSFYEISIEDNGAGISEDKLGNIFERFYRVDSSRNFQAGGSGLGLSIARQIVNAHGGDIWAESQLGEGTTIHFTLPKISEVNHETHSDH